MGNRRIEKQNIGNNLWKKKIENKRTIFTYKILQSDTCLAHRNHFFREGSGDRCSFVMERMSCQAAEQNTLLKEINTVF